MAREAFSAGGWVYRKGWTLRPESLPWGWQGSWQNQAKKRFSTPKWLRVTPEEVAQAVVDLAKKPRRSQFLPKIMGLSVFINSHFPGLSDRTQAQAFAPYHEQDLKE